jgi:4-amino-4-deoxy-L-arabinose transferase-like glycosyltransferase
MSQKTRRFLLLLGIVMLAAGPRLGNLTWRSLDGDEGASLYFSSLPLQSLISGFANLSLERHPLLYYFLLKGWRGLAGDADVALRLPSALFGVLVVALLYRIGRQRLGWPAGALAAAIAAVNPLIVYQNQDVRMYAPGLLFSVLAVWALLTALRQPLPRAPIYLALFTAAMTLAAYSHLIAGMLLPGLGLMILLELRRAGRVGWLAVGALGIVLLLYAPYLWNAYREAGAGGNALPLWFWLESFQGAARILLLYSAPLNSAAAAWALLGAVAAVTAVGVLRGGREGMILAAWFLPGWVLAVYVVMRIDFFQPKTFVFAGAPLALLWAAAAAGRARQFHWPMGVLAGVVIGLHLYGLSFLWRAGYQREDFRSAARFVSAHATPEDAVLVHLSWYNFIFGHYYPRPFVHPLGSVVPTEAEVAERLQPLMAAEVIWLVQAGTAGAGKGGDPGHVVEQWLAARYPVVTEVYPSGVDVKGYAVNYRTPALPASATRADLRYPDGLTLRGYRIPETALSVNDRWLHPPSTWVHATLYWSVAQPLSGDIRVAVTLEDEAGNVWGGDLPRGSDLRAFYPPLRWQRGEVIRQDFDVNTNPALAPGNYKVVLRVYSAGSDAPVLTETGEDWFILGRVTLAR